MFTGHLAIPLHGSDTVLGLLASMADLRSWLSCLSMVVSAVAAHGCGRFGYDAVDDRGAPDAAARADADQPDAGAIPGDAGATSDANQPEYHRLECEAGLLVGAMGIGHDPIAFAGAYAMTPGWLPAYEWQAAAPSLPPDRVELRVSLARGGTYRVWVRFHGGPYAAAAWYAGFSPSDLRQFSAGWTRWGWTTWRWTSDLPQAPSSPLVFETLAAGDHTLVVGPGQHGAGCDRVIVTDDLDFRPIEAP